MSAIELPDHQLEVLADLIVDRLTVSAAGELIDAAELARRIGRGRDFVYEHSGQLGAVRLGNGERPRLFFRWPQVLDRLDGNPKRGRKTSTVAIRPRRKRPSQAIELLPIGGPAARKRKP